MGGRGFQNREKLGKRCRGGVGGSMQGMEVPAMTGFLGWWGQGVVRITDGDFLISDETKFFIK